MSRRVKGGLLGFVCMFLLLGGVRVYAASTSSEMTKYDVMAAMTSRYGEEYDAPYTAAAGNVEISDGSVNAAEVDLTLPGKNGFDLNIIRTYRSQDLHEYFAYNNDGLSRWTYTYPMVKYSYGTGSAATVINVAFPREEDIVDTFYAKSGLSPENYPKTDDLDVGYFSYDNIKAESGVVCTRLQDEDLNYVGYYTECKYRKTTEKTMDIHLGAGWEIEMPGLDFVSSSFIGSSNDQNVRREFTDLNGRKYTLFYKGYVESDGIHPDLEEIENTLDYRTDVSVLQTHEKGFQYNVRIFGKDGTTYYYRLPAYFTTESVLPVAIMDRFNNTIYYSKNEQGAVVITDTLGRVVTVSANGIQVSDGSQTREIAYDLTEVYDQTRDPNGKIKYFSDYVFSVKKNRNPAEDAVPDYETTQYIMRYSSLNISGSSRHETLQHNFKLKKILYPTGAYVTYDYEDTAGVGKSVMGSPNTSTAKYDYYDYHIKAETTFDEGGQKNQRTYDYSYSSKPTNTTLITAYKKTVNETQNLPNGHTQKTTTLLDHLDRAYEKSTVFFEGNQITDSLKEKYSYSEGESYKLFQLWAGSSLRSRKYTNVMTFKNNKLLKSEDYTYTDKNEVTLKKQGEISSTYTYDANYGLRLTEETKQAEGKTIKVINTRTSDNKNIANSKCYENDVLKTETQYFYNSDGTIAEQRQIGEQENVVTKYQYNYEPGGAYTIKTRVEDVADAEGTKKTYTTEKKYDGKGNLAKEKDANGNETSYQYDMTGRILKQINPDGTEVKYAYDIANNTLAITDENGNTITRAYTKWGQIKSIYQENHPSELLMSYGYDGLNRKIYEASYDTPGHLSGNVSYSYDDMGRVTQAVNKDGNSVLDTSSVSYGYTERYEKFPANGSNGEYDVTGMKKVLIAVEASHNTAMRVQVFLDGEPQSLGALKYGEAGTYVLNTGNSSVLKVQGSPTYHILFLPEDSPSDIMGGEELETITTYQGDNNFKKPTERKITDAYGNIVEEGYYDGSISDAALLNKNLYRYDYAGNVIQTLGGRTYMENLGSYTTKTEYNYAGQAVKEYRADGACVTAEYDKLGRQTAATDYMGNRTEYTYDKLGRLIKTQTPFEGTEKTESISYYDGNGNVIRSRQKNNQPGETAAYTETENEYDSRNRLICVKVNDGNRNIYTQYAYDGVGNMTMMVSGQTEKIGDLGGTLPEGVTVMRYEYDRFGNVTKETDGLGRSRTAEYNQLGLPTKVTDKKGIETNNVYNAYGSLSQSQTEGEAPIVSSYTVNGMPLGSYEGNISTGIGYIYDKYGNIKREAELGSQIYKDYTYDVNGNRKSFTLKKGTEILSTVEYSYDNLDRITEVDFGESVGKVTYSYDANGRLLTETRGGITTSYSYNKAGLAVSMNSSEGSSYTYAYQLDGNMTQKMDNINGETTYEYNRLGQLTGETREKEGEGTQEAIYYIYDSRGNRIQKTDVFKKKLVRYSYDEGNQLKKEKEEPLPGAPCENPYEMETQYEYDGNGNVIFKWKGIEKEAGAGEEEVKLTAAGGKEGVETEEDYAYIYHYDNRNRMTGMESESVKANYSYDPMGRRKSKTVNGETTGHIWDKDNIVYETKGDGSKLASYYRGIHLAAIDNGAIDYYLYDNHGDITGMKNEGSSIVYDAFGNQTSDTTGGYNPFRYNSQYTDAESGLIYLRARYYDPSIGRFMAEDPVKDGLNWYAYCAGNPVMKVDPSGLAPGDLYLDIDDVVKDFLLYLRDEIGWRGEYEYSAALYEIKIGEVTYYSYNPPRTDYDENKVHVDEKVPEGTKYMGYAHSHPDSLLRDQFSSADQGLLQKGTYEYMVTPGGDILKMHMQENGEIEKFVKENGKEDYVFVVSTTMPANPESRRLKRKLGEKKISAEEYEALAEHERSMLEASKEYAKGLRNLQKTLIWELIRKKYPNAKPEEIYDARQRHPENWLDVLEELEK